MFLSLCLPTMRRLCSAPIAPWTPSLPVVSDWVGPQLGSMGAIAVPPIAARAVIESMVRRMVAEFTPERVILFGSRVHGTARSDSYVDLIVVMPVGGPRFNHSRYQAAVEIYRSLADQYQVSQSAWARSRSMVIRR